MAHALTKEVHWLSQRRMSRSHAAKPTDVANSTGHNINPCSCIIEHNKGFKWFRRLVVYVKTTLVSEIMAFNITLYQFLSCINHCANILSPFWSRAGKNLDLKIAFRFSVS